MSSSYPKVLVHGIRRLRAGFLNIDAAEYSFSDEGVAARRRTVEVLERGDSAAVAIHLVDQDELLLARQFRMPVRMREESEDAGWTLEIVAGVVAEGETPLTTARREAAEEVGLEIGECEHVATVFPSPGGSSERIFIYYAPVPGRPRQGAGGGLGDERIATELIKRQELFRLCRLGEINDAKTLIAAQWLMMR